MDPPAGKVVSVALSPSAHLIAAARPGSGARGGAVTLHTPPPLPSPGGAAGGGGRDGGGSVPPPSADAAAPVGVVSTPGAPVGVAFYGPDTLAVGCTPATLSLHRLAAVPGCGGGAGGGPSWSVANAHDGSELTGVAAVPGGPAVVSCGKDGHLRLWDAATGGAVSAHGGHKGWVRAVAAGHAGGGAYVLASAGRDKTVRVWDVRVGGGGVAGGGGGGGASGCVATLTGHDGWVHGVALAGGGEGGAGAGGLLVSCAGDKTVRVWDLRSPDAAAIVCRGHAYRVWGVDADGGAPGGGVGRVGLYRRDGAGVGPGRRRRRPGGVAAVRGVGGPPGLGAGRGGRGGGGRDGV